MVAVRLEEHRLGVPLLDEDAVDVRAVGQEDVQQGPAVLIERLDVGGLGPSDGPTGESFEAWCTQWIGEAPCPPSVPTPIAVFVVWGLICAVAVLAVAAYHAWSARPA